jgi:hypothetical protein
MWKPWWERAAGHETGPRGTTGDEAAEPDGDGDEDFSYSARRQASEQ